MPRSMGMLWAWVFAIVLGGLGLGTQQAHAQVELEGRLIQRLELLQPAEEGQFIAPDASTAQFASNQIRSAPGSAFSSTTITSDVARLNRTGRFRSVRSEAELLSDGGVLVRFILEQQPIVRGVQATGNNQISDQQIASQIDVIIGTPVDMFQIDRAARRIEDMYRDKGYYSARVTWDEDELTDSGIVVFVIREGERLRVTGIRFVGNEHFADREIRREISTRVARFIFSKGQLDDDKLEADVAAIYSFYRDRGFLDVRVDRRVQPAPNNREAIVEFLIAEGPRYTLRNIRIEIDDEPKIFTAEQLAGRMTIKPGDVYSINVLDVSVREVQAAYSSMGYHDAVVRRRELRDETEPFVDLLMFIRQGEPTKIGEIIIVGNELTQDKVVRRVLQQEHVRPERPLDRTNLDRSQNRIRATRLFRQDQVEITVVPEDPEHPGYRDVVVQVAETNTGEFSIGASINSDAGVVGQIALVQRNFDLFDTPDTAGDLFSGRAFRGAGQTFRIEALPGNQVQTYRVVLSEPSLFETDLNASMAVFFRQRQYREFDETRYGTRFAVGRSFGTRWSGSVALRLEAIDISDIDEDSPVDLFQVEDTNVITSIGASLVRQTLDDPFRPTRGGRSELAIQQIGALGGDFDYTQLSGDHSIFIPVYEDFLGRRTVLKLATSAEYIPQGQDEVPVYERLYLGGRSFRGFAFRTISPKGIRNDTGTRGNDPVGGIWKFFAGAEITQPIFEEIFSVAGFIDSGTVEEEFGFDQYRVSAGFGFRIYVPQLSPAPLAFDFGFPIVRQDDDRKRLFTFSIDLPF